MSDEIRDALDEFERRIPRLISFAKTLLPDPPAKTETTEAAKETYPVRQCYRTAPHDGHRWMFGDDFVWCPGLKRVTQEEYDESLRTYSEHVDEVVRANAPERAGREGDTQDLPTANDEVDTQSIAMQLISIRRQVGVKRYGTALQPGNGRDSLWDAVEESLDQFVYLLNYWREQHPGQAVPGLDPPPAE